MSHTLLFYRIFPKHLQNYDRILLYSYPKWIGRM